MNGEERHEFVRGHRAAIFGYARKTHGPSMSCCYYVMDRNDIAVSTMLGPFRLVAHGHQHESELPSLPRA